MPRKKTAHSKTKKSKKSLVILDIDPGKYFILCNGQTVKNYVELANILETIGDDVFQYHVNNERNDFATWIYDVFNEKELSESLKMTRNKIEMLKVLYKHLYERLLHLVK